MFEKKDLEKSCLAGGALSICVGAAGMVLSFVYLASASTADIVAGTSGFVAGSVLIGAGLVTCAIVATNVDTTSRLKSSDTRPEDHV